MNYKVGQFIATNNYGVGEIISESETENYYSFTVDFDIGDRSVNIKKDNSNVHLFRHATDEEISKHLKYRVYTRGEDRYLTNKELDNLKVGDWILHQRKGFGKIDKIRTENDNTFFDLSFADQPSSSMDKGKAKLVRFSLTHETSNEFWEPIDLSIKKDISKSEIVLLEEHIKKLPGAYIDFLQNYPVELVFFNRNRATEKLNELYLPNSVKGIINLFEQFEAFELSFLTPIGTDGLGNFYVIKEDTQAVFLIEHEGYFDKRDNLIVLNLKNFEKYAEKIADDIDGLVRRIVRDAIERSSKILNSN